jgi:lysophospholipase L1-like esterase
MNRSRKLVYLIISVTLVVSVLLFTIEAASYFILKKQGIPSSFALKPSDETILGRDQFREAYRTLDPHLGFTYGKNSQKLRDVQMKYKWLDGFLIYSDAPGRFKRPVILALGGSTTDGVKFPNSWPEQLAAILKQRNIGGTVINGAIGGYTTSQDLFKLIRDGVEFRPDIVISLDGVNDGLNYGIPNHLMVQPYQENILKVATGMEDGRLFPSTTAVLRQIIPKRTEIDYSLGLSSNRPPALNFRKNLELMNVTCISQGCKFYGVVQPFSYFRSKHANPNPESVGSEFIKGVNGLYNQILPFTKTHDFIFDATQALEGAMQPVYQADGVHLNDAGNKLIAEYMFNLIKDRLVK